MIWRRPADGPLWQRQIYLLLAVFLLLGPTFMPWYLLWALPFAILTRARAWPIATALALLSYLIYIDGIERAWWLAIGHCTIWALVIWDARRWRRAAGEVRS